MVIYSAFLSIKKFQPCLVIKLSIQVKFHYSSKLASKNIVFRRKSWKNILESQSLTKIYLSLINVNPDPEMYQQRLTMDMEIKVVIVGWDTQNLRAPPEHFFGRPPSAFSQRFWVTIQGSKASESSEEPLQAGNSLNFMVLIWRLILPLWLRSGISTYFIPTLRTIMNLSQFNQIQPNPHSSIQHNNKWTQQPKIEQVCVQACVCMCANEPYPGCMLLLSWVIFTVRRLSSFSTTALLYKVLGRSCC